MRFSLSSSAKIYFNALANQPTNMQQQQQQQQQQQRKTNLILILMQLLRNQPIPGRILLLVISRFSLVS
jgi:hypothetical protein